MDLTSLTKEELMKEINEAYAKLEYARRYYNMVLGTYNMKYRPEYFYGGKSDKME